MVELEQPTPALSALRPSASGSQLRPSISGSALRSSISARSIGTDGLEEPRLLSGISRSFLDLQDEGSFVSTIGDSTVAATVFALVCQMAGVGVLQLPYALSQGGWICVAVMLGCLAGGNYTGQLLIRSCYDHDGPGRVRKRNTYVEVGRDALGVAGEALVQVFEKATLFGVSVLFLILSASFLHDLLVGLTGFSMETWLYILAVFEALCVVFLRSIGELKIISLIGVVAISFMAVAVIVVSFTDKESDRPDRKEGPTEFIKIDGFAMAFSSMAMSVACHAGLPSIESTMADPKAFNNAIGLSYGILFALYAPIACVGYWAYGDAVLSPVLKSMPPKNPIQQVAMALVTTNVITTYPILMTLLVVELERILGLGISAGRPPMTLVTKRAILRTLAVIASAVVAVNVPYFADVMNFVGAVCISMTTFIMPSLFFIMLRRRELSAIHILIPVLVAVIGTTGGTIGAIQAVGEISAKLRSAEQAATTITTTPAVFVRFQ